MALHFLADDDSAEAFPREPGDLLVLVGAEAHHAVAVRRVRIGEPVSVTDGRGAWSDGSVEEVSSGRLVIRATSVRRIERSGPRFALVQALAKGGRDEQAVQMATELGVDEVVPWQADRSVSRWDTRKAMKGRQRWESITREASKQAHRAWLPQVGELVVGRDVAGLTGGATVIVLDPWTETGITDLAGEALSAERVLIIVGPEGGISPEELEALVLAGAHRVRLGEHVLRTSTAGPAALAVLSVRSGRWR